MRQWFRLAWCTAAAEFSGGDGAWSGRSDGEEDASRLVDGEAAGEHECVGQGAPPAVPAGGHGEE